MRTYEAPTQAPPNVAWRLLARRPWAWRVGMVVEMVHRVEPRPDGGATVAVDVIAPAALERPRALAYGPLIGFSLRRLARTADAASATPTAASGAGTPSPPAVPGRP